MLNVCNYINMFAKILFVCVCCVVYCEAEYDELKCVVNGAHGKCMVLRQCPSAIKDITRKVQPQICFFNPTSLEPIVCCLESHLNNTHPSDTQTSDKRTTTRETGILEPSTQRNNSQSSISLPIIVQTTTFKKPINATFLAHPSIYNSSSSHSSVFQNSSGISTTKPSTLQASTTPISVFKHVESHILKEEYECPPLKKEYLAKKKEIPQGHKAWEKCVEYQEKAVFPCAKNSSMRLDYCPSHNVTGRRELIIGGGMYNAEIGEFPHVALLGYGTSPDDALWSCGGSLISERFILTAGNCLSLRRERNRTNANGDVQLWTAPESVTYAAMGVLDRSAPLEQWDIYGIKKITKHPKYITPIKYDDIALLETDRIVQFSDLVFPACLHVGDEVPSSKAKAVGWGAEGYHWDTEVDVLLHNPVWRVSDEDCSFHYFPHVTLKRGYDNQTQVCYVDDALPRETCRGDNGGPLQISSPDIYCMSIIIGVTSFATVQCSSIGYPGIYTRVASYVPWIESVVWP